MKPTAERQADLAALRQGASEAPGSSVAHLRLGTALVQYGLMTEAVSELQRATELDPSLAAAWVNLGGALLARWDFAGCVEANRRAYACDATLVAAAFNEGLGEMYLGHAQEMLNCFERVLALEPENAAGHYYRATSLHALGRTPEARVSLGRATSLGHSPEPELLRALEAEQNQSVPVMELEPAPCRASKP